MCSCGDSDKQGGKLAPAARLWTLSVMPHMPGVPKLIPSTSDTRNEANAYHSRFVMFE